RRARILRRDRAGAVPARSELIARGWLPGHSSETAVGDNRGFWTTRGLWGDPLLSKRSTSVAFRCDPGVHGLDDFLPGFALVETGELGERAPPFLFAPI